MDNIIRNNFKQLVDIIKEVTPPSRQQPDYDCVATKGCNINDIITVGRKGEFYGMTVKVSDKIKPLFTDNIIIKGLELVCLEEYDAVIRLFDIKDEYIEYGYDTIYYTIYRWFKVCKVEVNLFKNIKFTFNCPNIITRLSLVRHDTINVIITIVNVGNNVIPSDWIGREFTSGKELHLEMNKLESRRGKPPVTYCCTFGMTKINNSNVNITKNLKINSNNIIYVELNKEQQAKFIKNIDNTIYTNYVEYNINSHKLIILFNPNDHFVNDMKLTKYSVGLLSSTLQKSIRHGSCSKEILLDTIKKLARSKPYNLPEQQFLKVSGTRQLFWRMFITCIEDFRFYYDIKHINLFDILILALITNMEPSYIVNDMIIDRMCKLGNAICEADNIHEWRKYSKSNTNYSENNNIWQNIISLTNFMPKMQGDNIMIQKYFNLLSSYKPDELTKNPNIVKCRKCSLGMTPKYTGIDIHCYPNMILKLQAITHTNYTTQELSSMVWEYNSKFNNRKPNEYIESMFTGTIISNITKLQKEYMDEFINIFDIMNYNKQLPVLTKNVMVKDCILSNYDKRILFLKIFSGFKIPSSKAGERTLEAVFSYNDKMIQIKYINSDEYIMGEEYDKEIERVYRYILENPIPITLDKCLLGYEWKINGTMYYSINMNKKPIIIINTNNIIECNWFDGSNLVKKQTVYDYNIMNDINKMVISILLEDIKMLELDANIEARKEHKHMFDIKKININKQTCILLKSILVKIGTSYDNLVCISPVSRSGDRVDTSVDYMYEGKMWQLLNLLHYCYPEAITIKGELNYLLNVDNYMYNIMLCDIKDIIKNKDNSKESCYIMPKLNNKLWQHQQETVNFIISNVIDGKRGFGDASNVGAGKTLTALATSMELFKYNIEQKGNNNSVLVLLPSENLIDTWIVEIKKHFTNINYLIQKSNGMIEGEYNNNMLNIYITTMGRNRDKMIRNNNDWLFVIVDECLTVQNKEAKQTMSAWEQVVMSKYGVILLSATFFRTRFDKLLYMLKMLSCKLPETKEYLDTILMDSIKVNLPINKRIWNETCYKEELSKEMLEKYNKVNNMLLSNEKKYIELKKFIRDNINYIDIFQKYIAKLSNKKLLIYATSKEEAEAISMIKDVGLYPDITKKHVVVSYAVGTYGLNNLVAFNHILTRPPEPDKLPQMKGRLDRMGQKENELNISYILIKNTIEEMEYMKLELCNKFYSNHIMPLGDFFNIKL